MHTDSPDGHGLWIGDTRFLSEYRLLIDGKAPEPVSLVADEGALVFEMKADPFVIRVERFVQSGLHERITISNPSSTSAGAHLDVVLAADFAAMLRVRSILPPGQSQSIVEAPGWQSLVLRESGSETHVTQVVVRPEGKHHRVELEPNQEFALRVDVMPGNGEEVKDFDGALQRIRDSYHGWSADCARFQTDNPRLNELIEQSLDDLRMLCERYSTGVYPTAGLPWLTEIGTDRSDGTSASIDTFSAASTSRLLRPTLVLARLRTNRMRLVGNASSSSVPSTVVVATRVPASPRTSPRSIAARSRPCRLTAVR